MAAPNMITPSVQAGIFQNYLRRHYVYPSLVQQEGDRKLVMFRLPNQVYSTARIRMVGLKAFLLPTAGTTVGTTVSQLPLFEDRVGTGPSSLLDSYRIISGGELMEEKQFVGQLIALQDLTSSNNRNVSFSTHLHQGSYARNVSNTSTELLSIVQKDQSESILNLTDFVDIFKAHSELPDNIFPDIHIYLWFNTKPNYISDYNNVDIEPGHLEIYSLTDPMQQMQARANYQPVLYHTWDLDQVVLEEELLTTTANPANPAASSVLTIGAVKSDLKASFYPKGLTNGAFVQDIVLWPTIIPIAPRLLHSRVIDPKTLGLNGPPGPAERNRAVETFSTSKGFFKANTPFPFARAEWEIAINGQPLFPAKLDTKADVIAATNDAIGVRCASYGSQDIMTQPTDFTSLSLQSAATDGIFAFKVESDIQRIDIKLSRSIVQDQIYCEDAASVGTGPAGGTWGAGAQSVQPANYPPSTVIPVPLASITSPTSYGAESSNVRRNPTAMRRFINVWSRKLRQTQITVDGRFEIIDPSMAY
jgi:hypothetical protein